MLFCLMMNKDHSFQANFYTLVSGSFKDSILTSDQINFSFIEETLSKLA